MVGSGVGEGSTVLSGTADGVGSNRASDAVAVMEGCVKASKTRMMIAVMGKANRKILGGVEVFILFSFEGTSPLSPG
jgi:hypothetical protein